MMPFLLACTLLLTGCTIELVVREPIPVKEMTLRAGEDLTNNAQRIIVVPDPPPPAPPVEQMLEQALNKLRAIIQEEELRTRIQEEQARLLKEQI